MELQSLLAEQSYQRSQDPLERSEMGKYAYVRTWTDTEWDEWRTYIEGLIKGLEFGYMIDYSGEWLETLMVFVMVNLRKQMQPYRARL
jgi:hypothetical protein